MILVDIFFTVFFYRMIFDSHYYRFNILSFWYHKPLDETIYFSSILCLLFFLNIYYEVYLFTTLKEKLEFYFKEVSLNKRINKKGIILGSMKMDNKPKEQNIPLENKTLPINTSKSNSEFEKVIDAYLKKAKRKLPHWLKKIEKHEIIKSIEEEIRESSMEFEEINNLKKEAIIQKVNDLGILRIILSDYIKQGTPKVYISKELWPWYLASLKSILTYFSIILIFIVILQIIFITSSNFFLISLTICFVGLPILILASNFFIFLSINDFIPEIMISLH